MADDYQYDLEERSLTQHWLTANVWAPLARRVPPAVKPNALTASGALAMVCALVLVRMGVDGNRWGFLGAVACTAWYLTADNIDGPHARRTGQTSQFGEFLDHWLDSINGAILCWASALCLGLSGAPLLVYVGFVATTYFATMWDQQQTGVLHSERWGANEAILVCMGLFLLLFFLPNASWVAYRPGAITLATLLVGCTVVGSTWTLIKILRRASWRPWGLLPLVLSVAVLWGLAFAGLVPEYVAAAGVLAINVLFSGSRLFARLAGTRPRYRSVVAVAGSVVGLALLLFWPSALVSLLASRIMVAGLCALVLIAIFGDLVRAARALRQDG